MGEVGVPSARENDTAGNGPIRGSAFSQIQREARMCSRNSRFALAKSEVAHHLLARPPSPGAIEAANRSVYSGTQCRKRDESEAVMVRAVEATNRCRVEVGEFMGVMMKVST